MLDSDAVDRNLEEFRPRRRGGVCAQTIQVPRQFRLPRIQVYSFSPRYFTPQYFTHANASRI